MTTDLDKLREQINERIRLGIDVPHWKAVELKNQQLLALLDELEALKAENESLLLACTNYREMLGLEEKP